MTEAERIELAKREILEDIASGRVPADVRDYASLHDYVDASEYGRLCEDFPTFTETVAGEWARDEWMSMANRVQEAVDAWLLSGRPM